MLPKVSEDDVRKEVTEDDVLWALKEAEKVMESIYGSRNVICSISIDTYPLYRMLKSLMNCCVLKLLNEIREEGKMDFYLRA